MRKLTLLALALISTCSFASVSSIQAPQLKSLGYAFKSHSTIAPKIDPKDITMGYAGQDVTSKPSIS